jgi:hypothetical protein
LKGIDMLVEAVATVSVVGIANLDRLRPPTYSADLEMMYSDSG